MIPAPAIKCFPQYKEMAAQWFSEKWQIPVEAYLDSIQISIDQKHFTLMEVIINDSCSSN
jgi:hypothetical protein